LTKRTAGASLGERPAIPAAVRERGYSQPWHSACEDVEGFLALFDADAVWVTGSGRRLIGLDAIAHFTRKVLPGAMSDGSVNYEVEHVAFIRSDVALTGVRQQYTDLRGQPKPGPSTGSPSYVWRRTGQIWKIVAGQNTGVVADDH